MQNQVLENEFDDDPVMIAVKAFHADKFCQHIWRKYFIAMQILEKSVSKAADDFLELVYTIQSEIKNDGIQPRGKTVANFHAFLFQDRLKKIFLARYGYVDFNKLLPVHQKK